MARRWLAGFAAALVTGVYTAQAVVPAADSDGRLWAVSEAGSRHIYDHPFLGLFEPFFPLVFALDLSRLE